tara:strand:+ start:293 stop:535 length:243 start_codon:yes stop_codon:yes gene_type:complete
MDDSKITEAFIERIVDKVITEITDKLDELDISLDYIAAALLGTSAISIGGRQRARGRGAKIAGIGGGPVTTPLAADKESA